MVLKPPFGDPHFLSRSVGGSETSASASDRVALSFATISSDPALLDQRSGRAVPRSPHYSGSGNGNGNGNGNGSGSGIAIVVVVVGGGAVVVVVVVVVGGGLVVVVVVAWVVVVVGADRLVVEVVVGDDFLVVAVVVVVATVVVTVRAGVVVLVGTTGAGGRADSELMPEPWSPPWSWECRGSRATCRRTTDSPISHSASLAWSSQLIVEGLLPDRRRRSGPGSRRGGLRRRGRVGAAIRRRCVSLHEPDVDES